MNVSIQIVVAILQYTYQVYIFCMNIVMYSFLSSLKVDFLILYSNCKSVTFETILSHILVSYTKYVSIVFHGLFFTYFFQILLENGSLQNEKSKYIKIVNLKLVL